MNPGGLRPRWAGVDAKGGWCKGARAWCQEQNATVARTHGRSSGRSAPPVAVPSSVRQGNERAVPVQLPGSPRPNPTAHAQRARKPGDATLMPYSPKPRALLRICSRSGEGSAPEIPSQRAPFSAGTKRQSPRRKRTYARRLGGMGSTARKF